MTFTLWYINTSKSTGRGVITTTASGTMSQSNPTDNGEGYGNEDMDDPALLELLEFHEGGRMSEDDVVMVANDEEGEDDIMAAGCDEIVDDDEEEGEKEEDSDDEESDDEDDDEGEDEDDDDGSDDSAAAKVSGVRVLAKIVWGENEE